MRIACRTTKATHIHTLTIYNIYCFPTTTVVAKTRLGASYTQIACLVVMDMSDLVCSQSIAIRNRSFNADVYLSAEF